jgi:hypothetical protein
VHFSWWFMLLLRTKRFAFPKTETSLDLTRREIGSERLGTNCTSDRSR